MSDSSPWYSSELRFFARIRRFLQIKTAGSRYGSSGQFEKGTVEEEKKYEPEMENETEDDLIVLQRSVKKLHFGSWEEKETAAKEIKILAREDLRTRKSLAALGVVPSLMSMIDSEVLGRRRLAVQALIELANGTYTNKALMVEAGILSKLPENIDTLDESSRHDFAVLLLSISSLANTQFPIVSSKVLSFLIGVIDSNVSMVETKEACLGSLYNISIMLDNVGPLVSNGVVHTLLTFSSVKETAEKALATLGNLVVTVMGKKAMENESMVPESLIEIMTWEEKPKCQELAAYILMILAYQSSAQREKMARLGVIPVLLEVALLGGSLAQKRALKLLQWFKDERQTKMGAHSGPQTGIIGIGSPMNQRENQEGKKMMKNMVKQSLDKNMELITRRANASGESSNLNSLVISSSSKSLPF
ncbi:hypothetical protein HHK36_001757 [Tetracentron sinense]|uniref:U-box domain-containing protein 7 n=1 Tax=Tetracentron sinense TaxID=13715 RepID=A0A835DV03_TETSI|nr:hypothetical protein HHK36_001757 [Tetracentron sinense]